MVKQNPWRYRETAVSRWNLIGLIWSRAFITLMWAFMPLTGPMLTITIGIFIHYKLRPTAVGIKACCGRLSAGDSIQPRNSKGIMLLPTA